MSEEKKKGGFWASLFGRNKKQEEQKIEPIIEEPSVEPVDVSPEEEIVHAEENVQLGAFGKKFVMLKRTFN